MNRRLLVSLMAFGAVITLVGAAGIFAVFTDRATTGTNSVTSGARASAAHLQIASLAPGTPDCAANPDAANFVDDLATGLFTITDAQPTGLLSPSKFVCLKNAGSADLAISTAVIDLVNVETECTGDEAAAGDNTCGIVAGVPGAGELAQVLSASVVQIDCSGSGPIPGTGTTGSLQILATIPGGASLGFVMGPGSFACLQLNISYPQSTTDTAVQIAQSDQVTWRYAFDGTTS